MAKIIGIVTAKISTKARTPNKVLLPLAGKSSLTHHIERMRAADGIEGVYVATSRWPGNEPVEKITLENNCDFYSGDENDVIERHIRLCEKESADACIRIPCDSPFFDYEVIAKFTDIFQRTKEDYIFVHNVPFECSTMPELISLNALRRAHCDYRGPAVTLPIWENWNEYQCVGLNVSKELVRPEYRLAVDSPADYVVASHIYNDLYEGEPLRLVDVYEYLDENSYLGKMVGAHANSPINKRFIRAQKNVIAGTDS